MPTDAAGIATFSKAIVDLSQTFQDSDFKDKEVQKRLVIAAEKLAIATREHDENVYHTATQIAHNAALRTIIAMGVFDEMPIDGTPISTANLASRLGVNEAVLTRIIRACASTHLFANPKPNYYAHTALSLAYTNPNFRAMTAQMYDFTCKGVFAIPEFLSENKFSHAGTYDKGAFQLGAHTEQGFWEYLNSVPERMELFNAGMRATTTIGTGKLSGAFPFGDALAKNPCRDNEVAVVDVGGGRGQALEAIWNDYPGISGRFILQDQPHVIADAKAKGLPEFMETSEASFFEPQVIKGARIYYFRRIFHDWDQDKGHDILSNTVSAMNAHSRVLIADMALPDVDAPRDMALQDLNMMSFGGMERSETQWKELLQSCGLELRNIWKGTNGGKHAVIEAALPGFQGVDVAAAP